MADRMLGVASPVGSEIAAVITDPGGGDGGGGLGGGRGGGDGGGDGGG